MKIRKDGRGEKVFRSKTQTQTEATIMKKLVLALWLILVMAVPAFAGGYGDTTNNYYNDYDTTNQGGTAQAGAIAGAKATVGDVQGGSVNIGTGFLSGGNFSPSASSKIEKGAVDVDVDPEFHNMNMGVNLQGQKQKQDQEQEMNNKQLIAPKQTTEIKIKTEKPYLAAPSVGVAELNFGQGKVDWYFANALPKIGIPLYKSDEIVIKVLDTKANIPIKRVLIVALEMKEAQAPLCYNDRIIVVKAEAQKSWTSGGSLSGAGSGVLGTSGAAGSGSLIPSIGGTKAHDLYTIIIVKVSK